MPEQHYESSISVGQLENGGFETGCVGAFCNVCLMWIGPHRDTEEEAESDANRHLKAVRQQQERSSAHAARVTLDNHEAEIMRGLLEEDPDDEPDFGPFFADCSDCGGYVGLGRVGEEEAVTEAEKHRAAFQNVAAAS